MQPNLIGATRILHVAVVAVCLMAAVHGQATTAAPPSSGAAASRGGVVVNPGTTSASLQAIGCDETTIPPQPFCLGCSTSCDIASNTAGASVFPSAINLGPKFATASLYTDFEVGACPQTVGNLVTASINYDVDWLGEWFVLGVFGTGLGSAEAIVTLSLEDVTDSMNVKILKTVELHKEEPDDQIGIDIVNVGVWVDVGDVESCMTALLKRGHQYRIRLKMAVEVIYVIPTAGYLLAYGPAPLQGAAWNNLTVTVGEDPLEKLPGVATKQGNDFIALTGGNALDCLATHTIMTPAPGYVMVTATGQANAFHQNGTVTQANFGVTDDVEVMPLNQDLAFSISSGYPSGTLVAPVTAQSVFPAPAKGPHTYYFMAQSATGGMSVHDIQLTLCYVPMAYGMVSLPIQAASNVPTFEQEYWNSAPRPALSPWEIAAEREVDIEGYLRYLDERARELERVNEERRILREALRLRARNRQDG